MLHMTAASMTSTHSLTSYYSRHRSSGKAMSREGEEWWLSYGWKDVHWAEGPSGYNI